jgi:hypothetical protein
MEPMSANAPGVPSWTSLLLLLGSLLLPVAAFPARLRVVILKRKHPQPRSNNQSNKPENRVDDTPTLVPRGHADDKKTVDKELDKDRGEVKQKTELKKLDDVRTKRVPAVLKAEGVIAVNAPG